MRNFVPDKEISRIILSYIRRNFCNMGRNFHFKTIWCSSLTALMQIGELSNHLSEDFKVIHSDIPWNAIRGMRNIVAHEYGNIDFEIVWETATVEIKELCDFCIGIIADSK